MKFIQNTPAPHSSHHRVALAPVATALPMALLSTKPPSANANNRRLQKTTEPRRPRPSDSHRIGLLNVPLKRILSERTAQLMIISSENILATNK